MTTAAGRTVYGNGSYAPNRGPVSAVGAQGYIKREIARQNKAVQQGPYSTQPVGRDGQSDRRSGVAQAAMGQNKPKPAKTVKPGSGGSQPRPVASGGSQGASQATPAAPSYQPVTQIVTSPTGTLSLTVDSQFAPDIESAYSDYLQFIADQEQTDRDNALEYQEALRQANANYADVKQDTLDNSAGRGVAYSSAYSTAVGKNEADYNNNVGYLNQLNTNNQITGNNNRTLAQEAFNRRLQSVTQQNAAYQAQTASSYATPTQTATPTGTKVKPKEKEKPKPKPKPKAKK